MKIWIPVLLNVGSSLDACDNNELHHGTETVKLKTHAFYAIQMTFNIKQLLTYPLVIKVCSRQIFHHILSGNI